MHSVLFEASAVTPSKIVCVGRNYVAHIRELGNEIPADMVVFNKPNSAISRQLRAQVDGETLHYESEIALLIKGGDIAGVGFGLDLTRRELQSSLKQRGLPWERAKAFDGAALFSDFVPAPAAIDSLSLRLSVDGELRQAGGVPLMIYPPARILEELRRFTTLEDGDIVMTGTPEGVGAIRSGQLFHGSLLQGERELVSATWRAL
ncbi:MAG: fumarylacetoacetate hydrolase family protein [Halieaceae bacterium]|nr:fumarylacetoacetate hydrolase family protein [Halieaceae bacterium]MCP5164197.1 fumarylacetoacetate hydrolase family protein [Pseudomonadales bacterium]MCP5203727.1 fumarylacetoacetate hydrolase family protein [Pseudomonadales bacterium]